MRTVSEGGKMPANELLMLASVVDRSHAATFCAEVRGTHVETDEGPSKL